MRKLPSKLVAAQKIYRMVAKVKGGHHSNSIDICKFATNECCHIEEKFFNAESELAMDDKLVKLHNWRTDLNMNDYKLPDLLE